MQKPGYKKGNMIYPKMLRDLVLVKIPKTDDATGKIKMPEEMEEEERYKADEGVVVAIGPDCTVAKGDIVLPKSYVGNDLPESRVDDPDNWYRIISENDIMAYYPMGKVN